MGKKAKDYTGQKVGSYTVLMRVEGNTSNNDARWLVRCDCGEEKVYSSKLLNGALRSGYIFCKNKLCNGNNVARDFYKDFIGKKVGNLTALCEAERKIIGTNTLRRMVRCQCDCGNSCDVELRNFASGLAVSCGCKQEIAKKNNRDSMIGKRFGRLVVTEFSHDDSKLRPYFRVKCDCGTEKVIRGDSLSEGKSESCGCLRNERVSNALRNKAQLRRINAQQTHQDEQFAIHA